MSKLDMFKKIAEDTKRNFIIDIAEPDKNEAKIKKDQNKLLQKEMRRNKGRY